MLYSITNYFYERRRGFARTAGYAGAAYLVGTYIKERLEEVKNKVVLERKARDK
jgi:peroxin-3